MAKDKITDYSATAASNTDVGGVNIGENCAFGNVNDAIRELQSHLAEANAGTYPVSDTWTFGDPADLTKRIRFDAGNVTAGQTRVVNVPDQNGTMVLTTGTQTLSGKSFVDTTDSSKVLAFSLSGITTSTTRTITWPDASGTVMLAGQYPTAVSLEGLSLVSGDILYATAADTLARLAKGTDGTFLTLNSGVPSWGTPTNNVKAWVNFNGTTGTIIGSNNVTSVTRSSAGVYTINFTTAISDANYAVVGSVEGPTGVGGRSWVQYENRATTSVKINVTDVVGTATDEDSVSVLIIR